MTAGMQRAPFPPASSVSSTTQLCFACGQHISICLHGKRAGAVAPAAAVHANHPPSVSCQDARQVIFIIRAMGYDLCNSSWPQAQHGLNARPPQQLQQANSSTPQPPRSHPPPPKWLQMLEQKGGKFQLRQQQQQQQQAAHSDNTLQTTQQQDGIQHNQQQQHQQLRQQQGRSRLGRDADHTASQQVLNPVPEVKSKASSNSCYMAQRRPAQATAQPRGSASAAGAAGSRQLQGGTDAQAGRHSSTSGEASIASAIAAAAGPRGSAWPVVASTPPEVSPFWAMAQQGSAKQGATQHAMAQHGSAQRGAAQPAAAAAAAACADNTNCQLSPQLSSDSFQKARFGASYRSPMSRLAGLNTLLPPSPPPPPAAAAATAALTVTTAAFLQLASAGGFSDLHVVQPVAPPICTVEQHRGEYCAANYAESESACSLVLREEKPYQPSPDSEMYAEPARLAQLLTAHLATCANRSYSRGGAGGGNTAADPGDSSGSNCIHQAAAVTQQQRLGYIQNNSDAAFVNSNQQAGSRQGVGVTAAADGSSSRAQSNNCLNWAGTVHGTTVKKERRRWTVGGVTSSNAATTAANAAGRASTGGCVAAAVNGSYHAVSAAPCRQHAGISGTAGTARPGMERTLQWVLQSAQYSTGGQHAAARAKTRSSVVGATTADAAGNPTDCQQVAAADTRAVKPTDRPQNAAIARDSKVPRYQRTTQTFRLKAAPAASKAMVGKVTATAVTNHSSRNAQRTSTSAAAVPKRAAAAEPVGSYLARRVRQVGSSSGGAVGTATGSKAQEQQQQLQKEEEASLHGVDSKTAATTAAAAAAAALESAAGAAADNSSSSSSIEHQRRAAYEQRRLVNQHAKARVHQLLQQHRQQQEQSGTAAVTKVSRSVLSAVTAAVAAEFGVKAGVAAVKFVYRYQLWGAEGAESAALAATVRVGASFSRYCQRQQQQNPCQSSALLSERRRVAKAKKQAQLAAAMQQ